MLPDDLICQSSKQFRKVDPDRDRLCKMFVIRVHAYRLYPMIARYAHDRGHFLPSASYRYA